MDNFNHNTWGRGIKCESDIPKILWTFWDAPSASPLVDLCLHQVRSFLPDYELNIITVANANSYIAELPAPRSDISFINYTDLVRLEVLKKYGGIYFDASVLLTERLDWVHEIRRRTGAEMVGFYAEEFMTHNEFPLIETWCIAAVQNSPFITAWAVEFEKCYASANPHIYFNFEKREPSFLQKIDYSLSDYLIAYLAAAKVMRNSQNFRLTLYSANDTAHYYTFGKNRIEIRDFAAFFLRTPPPGQYPKLIKFMNSRRGLIDSALRNGLYNSEGFLFKVTGLHNSFAFNIVRFARYIKFIAANVFEK